MTFGILLWAIFLFVTYHEFCLERLVLYESLLVLLFSLSQVSLLDTYLREPKLCYDLLEFLFMLHLIFFELWNCSSTSLISFWAWCGLIFLKKCSHTSLRLIWELVNFWRNFLCSCSSLKFVWACQKQLQYMKLVPKW